MSGLWKKAALTGIAGLFLLLLVALLVADTWLESAAGKRRLEATLSGDLGLTVHLRGELHVSLFPVLGISGTQLEITGINGGPPFIQSRAYHVSVALLPLFGGAFDVIELGATGGSLNPAQYQASPISASGSSDGRSNLPRIQRLLIEDFDIVLPGSAQTAFWVRRLELERFQTDEPAPMNLLLVLPSETGQEARVAVRSRLTVAAGGDRITLEIENLKLESAALGREEFTGRLNWDAEASLFDTRLSWLGPDSGSAELAAELSAATREGSISLEFIPPGTQGTIAVLMDLVLESKVVLLPRVLVSFDEMEVTGSGCLLTTSPPALHLRMQSAWLDLDRLLPLLPDTTGAQGRMPLDLAVQLLVAEAHSSGAVARGAEVSVGQEPDCDFR